MMAWDIKKMGSQTQDEFIHFLGRFIKNRSASSHYQWLYCKNPHGNALSWLAIHNETHEIIGCTSIFPRKIWLKDKITLGCVGGDTFVDPRFRRQGIATALHQVSINDMKESSIKFHYGFPNTSNLKAFIKAGSVLPGKFRSMVYLLKSDLLLEKWSFNDKIKSSVSNFADKILSSRVKFKLSKNERNSITVQNVTKFDKKFDRLLEEVIPYFNICGLRDSAYLNWRYFETPLKPGGALAFLEKDELVGFCCYENYNNILYLIDFFSKPEDQLVKNLICNIIRIAISKGCHSIKFFTNPIGLYTKCFSNLGFTFGALQIPLQVLLSNDDRDIEYMKNLENWHLTFGDYDLALISPN